MEYEDFERLYRGNPVIFHLALDILMGSGRDAIASFSDQTLRAKAAHQLSSFFSDEKIEAIAEAARDFAGLKNMDLLTYASRCGIKLEGDPLDKPGVCPLCGGSLIYGEDASTHRPHAAGWTCEDCGATGKEAYREVFDCHYDVLDGTGDLVVGRNKNRSKSS